MQISYKRNGLKNYMVVRNDRSDAAGLHEKMIIRNRIGHIARMTPQNIDGRAYYYYDIQGRVSLESLFTGRSMTLEEVSAILQSLAGLLSELERYLLTPDEVLFSPEYIWLTPDTLDADFIYVPGMAKDEAYGILRFAEYLTDHVDGDDRDAAALAYGYLEMAENGYIMPDIRGDSRSRSGNSFAGYRADGVMAGTGGADSKPAIPFEDYWDIKEGINDDVKALFEGGSEKKRLIDKKRLSYICMAAAMLISALYIAFVIDPTILPIVLTDEEYIMAGAGIAIGFALILIGVLYINRRRSDTGSENKTSGRTPAFEDESFMSDGMVPERDDLEYQEYQDHGERGDHGRSMGFENYGYSGGYDDGDRTVLLKRPQVHREAGRFPTLTCEDGRQVIIRHFPFVMGKMESRVDEVIQGEGISRIHAMLKEQDNRYYISDLNSLNGTAVSGRALEANETAEIKDGDIISLADTNLTFHIGRG